MSNVQPMPADSKALAVNQAVIRGRIIDVKKTDEAVYTAVILPAPDQYSQPEAVEVRSRRLIGKPQDDITIRVTCGGFRRAYTDKNGEKQFATNVVLRAIED